MSQAAHLLGDLDALTKLNNHVGKRLLEVAEDLAKGRFFSEEGLGEKLIQLRQEFFRLRDRVVELANQEGLPGIPVTDELTTLSSLDELLKRIRPLEDKRAKYQDQKKAALAALDKMARLAHRDIAYFSSLGEIRNNISRLRSSLAQATAPWTVPELIELLETRHPLNDLLVLAERHQEIDDDGWDQIEERVRQNFPADLARAALRGKLVLTDSGARPNDPTPTSVPCEQPVVPQFPNASLTFQNEESNHGPADLISPQRVLETGPSMLVTKENASDACSNDVEIKPACKEPSKAAIQPSTFPGVKCTLALPPILLAPATPKGEIPKQLTIFSAKLTAKEMATALRTGKSHPRVAGLTDLVWRLLFEKRIGIAFHLAQVIDGLFPDQISAIPPAAIRALGLGSLVSFSSGEIVEELRGLAEPLLHNVEKLQGGQGNIQVSKRMLLFGLALRPALLAPLTGMGSILEALSLDEGFNALHGLRQGILDYTRIGLELSPSILKGIREHAAWASKLRDLQEGARNWLQEHRQKKLIYSHTSNAWRHWLRDDGILGNLLITVIEDRRADQEQVRANLREFSSQARVQEKLARTDKQLRGRQADLRPIENRARPAVFRQTQDALHWCLQWLDLLASEPRGLSDFRYQQADQCRNRLIHHLELGKKELQEFAKSRDGCLPVACGAGVALAALLDLETLLDPTAPENQNGQLPCDILHADLLRLTELPLDEDWQPLVKPESLLDSLLQLVAEGFQNWQSIFESHAEAQNHLATLRILEHLKRTPEESLILETLQKQREERLRECQLRLQREIDSVRMEIEKAVSYDLLVETDRLELTSKVEAILPEHVLNFQEVLQDLKQINMMLGRYRDQRSQQVRERLQSTDIGQINPEAFGRIENALQKGHFLEANEYIDLVQSGESFPELEDTAEPFGLFFPDFVQQICKFLESGPEPRSITSDIKHGGRMVGPLDMTRLHGKQAENAAKMVENWWKAKREQRGLKEVVTELFNSFGCKVLSIVGKDPVKGDKEWWAELHIETIAERSICPVPQFGSLAGGHFRLLGLWDRPAEDEIINLAERQPSETPLIVLYFGRMVVPWRREFAYQCRRRRSKLLLLDEALVFYLCGERSRLPVLFQCMLPFVTIDPYTTTAGLVPQEMFFGRENARKSVIDPFGTCLVYGGRQLGKTALLRYVERRYHNAENGWIVKWIDLKAEGIGINRSIDDIWSVIAGTLHSEGVIPTSQISTPKTLRNRIQDWLSKNNLRRIVLLLDEADAFLEGDSKEKNMETTESFPNLGAIKGIMDATERRFKVVFAGLHNVQRTARDVNSPLAHLGQPQCVGPLFESGEWREAMRLIEVPFKTLGYRFESEDLPLRILSHTNYYPSLIQLFCKHLLGHLTNANKSFFESDQCPPYVVTAQHVEDAYQSEELRKAILDRFTWTLNLDPRYRLIALCIALNSVEHREAGVMTEGVAVSWVREQALGWWDKGFQDDTSLEAFRTILEEMIGLGVLRKVGNNYALRSPNLLNLLGTHDEIWEQLDDATRSVPPPKYEAANFRRSLRGDIWRLSSLTAQQEAEVLNRTNGVAVLFGAPVSGLDDVPKFLEAALPADGHIHTLNDVQELGTFRRQLATIYEDSHDGMVLIVIPATSLWSEQWLQEAVAYLAAKRSKQKFARIVFLGDPEAAWSWTGVDGEIARQLRESGIIQLSLKPWTDWTLRRWLLDTGFGPHDDDRERQRFHEITGGWSEFVHEIGQGCRANGLHKWSEQLATMEREQATDKKGVFKQFGLLREAVPIMQIFTTLDMPLDGDDILDLQHGLDREMVNRVIVWADLLNYLGRGEKGKWIIGPAMRRMLTALT